MKNVKIYNVSPSSGWQADESPSIPGPASPSTGVACPGQSGARTVTDNKILRSY